MTTTALELHKRQTSMNNEGKPITRNTYFLIHIEKCFDCPHIKEGKTEMELALSTCEECLHDLLRSTGFINSIKLFDTERYEITISEKTPVSEGNKTKDEVDTEETTNDITNPLDDDYFTQFSNPITAKRYTTWIIDQVKSGNHYLINDAINGSLICKEIKENYLLPIFNELVTRNFINIIEKDEDIKEYYLVTEDTKTETETKTEEVATEEEFPSKADNYKNENKELTVEVQKRQKFEQWIIEQIRSGNQAHLKRALSGSLFATKVWERYGNSAYQHLLEENIIKKDDKTGEYYIVDEVDSAVKEPVYTHYVSYLTSSASGIERKIENCTSLMEALKFIKVHEIQNYCIGELKGFSTIKKNTPAVFSFK